MAAERREWIDRKSLNVEKIRTAKYNWSEQRKSEREDREVLDTSLTDEGMDS